MRLAGHPIPRSQSSVGLCSFSDREASPVTVDRARLLPPSALAMHPGPVRRGVGLVAEVVDSPVYVITAQVADGAAVRMSVLYMLLGSGAQIGT